MRSSSFVNAVWFLLLTSSCLADDWPQWMGPRRDDVWRETGIVQEFPSGGPAVLWRVPIQGGYSGPAVVGKRLFVLDRPAAGQPDSDRQIKSDPKSAKNERVLCLDAGSGKTIWEHTYPRAYDIGYPAGPRTTPTVADGKVFTLGAMGDLLCLRTDNGERIWGRNFPQEYNAKAPVWGWAAHPLLDGDRLICLVGGSNSAVVAFQKDTGKEVWRALNAVEIGYVPPIIYTIHGRRELIVWHPDAVSGLDPQTGKLLWSQSYPIGGEPKRPEVTIATSGRLGSPPIG
jgi:outer membrane protein assembly factor BamB